MRIRGLVTGVRTPEQVAGDTRKPATWVSVEGFSAMLGETAGAAPLEGREIEGVVTCRWKDGKRPLFILTCWELAI